jgi:hypothetical protein
MCLLILALASQLPCLLPAAAEEARTTNVTIDVATQAATVPEGLYGAGYNGWRDILDERAVKYLQEVGIRYLRLPASLAELCGDKPGQLHLGYVTPPDCGVGFADRVKTVIRHGWTPILATAIHSSAAMGAVPRWFYGEDNDSNQRAWYRFNREGTPAAEGRSDQYELLSAEMQRVAAGLARQGLRGLLWETIYECGHTTPMVEIHYHVARGIRAADPTARIMGPATWPGWTVEERFVKPFLTKYGADLLDYVSVHWYATNAHALWDTPFYDVHKPTLLTRANEGALTYLMEHTPEYGRWCASLRKLLEDPALNPKAKRIGIAFTEYDASHASPYLHSPVNPDWPDYRADADCYVNTDCFGGVWCASVLCNLAVSGSLDIALKYNTRHFYGLLHQGGPDNQYFRPPIWYAWRLLQTEGGLLPGARMAQTQVDGPMDNATEHKMGVSGPWVEAFAVADAGAVRLILVNRSLYPQTVSLALPGLKAAPALRSATRYVFSEDRVARFIGRKPNTDADGNFEGAPDDTLSARCLEPVDRLPLGAEGGTLKLADLHCPPISLTVLRLGGGE